MSQILPQSGCEANSFLFHGYRTSNLFNKQFSAYLVDNTPGNRALFNKTYCYLWFHLIYTILFSFMLINQITKTFTIIPKKEQIAIETLY